MRKIIVGLLCSAIFMVLINFGFWFYHTRVITKSVEMLSKHLEANGINLSYGEILFNTFKYWDVKGSIDNVKITTFGTNSYKNQKTMEYSIEKIFFESKPLDANLKIYTGKEKRIFQKFLNSLDQNNVPTTVPTKFEIRSESEQGEIIEIDFLNSISEIMKISEMINGDKDSKVADIVKRASYINNKNVMIDIEKGINYNSTDEFSITLSNSVSDNNYVYNFLLNLKNSHYNIDYPFDEETRTIFNDFGLFDEDGTNLCIDFILSQKDEESIIATAQNTPLPQSEAAKLKKFFNHYHYKFNKVSFNSSLFNAYLTGTLSLVDGKDQADLNFELTNYNNLFKSFAKGFNLTMVKPTVNPILGVREITETDLNNLNNFATQFSDKDNIKIAITKSIDESSYKLNGKNASEVFFDFLKVLYSNNQNKIKEDGAIPQPHEKSENKPLPIIQPDQKIQPLQTITST